VSGQGKTRGGLALGAVWLFAAAARATTLVPADLGELVREADAIVRGRVVETRAVWTDGRRAVDTLVTLAVEEYFKGHFGPRVVFRVPGGQMGRYLSLVPGAPVFLPGEAVVVFLRVRGPAVPVLVGLGQGVARLAADGSSGRLLVVSPPLDSSGGEAKRLARGDLARRPMPLEEFRTRITRYLTAEAGGRAPRPRAAARPARVER
jgi:hypothetical protein